MLTGQHSRLLGFFSQEALSKHRLHCRFYTPDIKARR